MEDSSFNLFSPDSHSQKKPSKPKSPQRKMLPPRKPPAHKEASPGIEETEDAIQQIKTLHSELNAKIDKTYERSGRDPREVTEYFSDPNNFTPYEWDKLQKRKAELEAKIMGISVTDVAEKKVKKNVTQMSKDRKSKTLGARKNWLPMR